MCNGENEEIEGWGGYLTSRTLKPDCSVDDSLSPLEFNAPLSKSNLIWTYSLISIENLHFFPCNFSLSFTFSPGHLSPILVAKIIRLEIIVSPLWISNISEKHFWIFESYSTEYFLTASSLWIFQNIYFIRPSQLLPTAAISSTATSSTYYNS